MSNVGIASEFSDMIITQRVFQSNSKIITVGDGILETLINMKNLNTTASYDFALMGRFFMEKFCNI